jgi:DNA-binding NarL/FixJ family response regulator
MTRPRLLLADDHEDLLHEVTALLQGEFEVVGVARDGVSLMDIAAHLNPDVVVTDFRMPGLSGIDAGGTLLERGLCKAVVLLTIYGTSNWWRAPSTRAFRGSCSKRRLERI